MGRLVNLRTLKVADDVTCLERYFGIPGEGPATHMDLLLMLVGLDWLRRFGKVFDLAAMYCM